MTGSLDFCLKVSGNKYGDSGIILRMTVGGTPITFAAGLFRGSSHANEEFPGNGLVALLQP